MRTYSFRALLVAGLLSFAPLLHSQQDLIPELFPGVQIGSVVLEDGSVVRTQAFSLDTLAPAIVVQSLQTQQQAIRGNSTYNYGASAQSLVGSLSFEFGGGALGNSTTGEFSTSGSSQAQNIDLTSVFVGTNRLAYIDFQQLTPNSLMASLNFNLLQEGSSLQDLATGINNLAILLETTPDPNSPLARQYIADIAAAKARFQRNFGVGFVSGVVLGGAAAVRGEFSSSATSSRTRWNASGRIYGATATSRFELSTALGVMHSNQLGNASFSVTSSSLGGSAYISFANRFRDLFADRSLAELWNRNLAELPSTEGLLGSQQPNLPPLLSPTPPKSVPSLAAKFAPIENADQLRLYNQALAFDRWNRETQNGQGTFEQFEQFQREQADEVRQGDPNRDTLIGDDDNQARISPESGRAEFLRIAALSAPTAGPEVEVDTMLGFADSVKVQTQSALEFLRTNRVLQAVRLIPNMHGLALLPQFAALSVSNTAAASAASSQNYWNAVQGDFEVIAVETTRWEDVIPGLGFADALIANTLAARDFVEANRVLQTFQFISNMYGMAASCVRDGSRDRVSVKYSALANAFLRYERELSARLEGEAFPIPIVEEFLANLPPASQAIYQVFVLNRDLFTAGEVGMGGYGVFRHLVRNGGEVRARFQGLNRLRPRGAGARFNTRWGLARNTALALHSPTLYETSVKFFPLLEPDIENFVADGVNSRYQAKIRLMASTFDPQGNGTAINGFLSQVRGTSWLFSSDSNEPEVIEFPLEKVREETVFGSQEFVLPIPTGVLQALIFNTDEGKTSWGTPNEVESLVRLIEIRNGEVNAYRLKEIRLKPFTVEDLVGLQNWRGFIAYERRTQTVLEEFWQEVTRNFARIANGENYFTVAFARRPINLDLAFDPLDLAQFSSYLGLIDRPTTSGPSR